MKVKFKNFEDRGENYQNFDESFKNGKGFLKNNQNENTNMIEELKNKASFKKNKKKIKGKLCFADSDDSLNEEKKINLKNDITFEKTNFIIKEKNLTPFCPNSTSKKIENLETKGIDNFLDENSKFKKKKKGFKNLKKRKDSLSDISEFNLKGYEFEAKKFCPEKFKTNEMIVILQKIVKNFKTGTFSQKIYFRERERKEIIDFIINNFFSKEKEKNLLSTMIIFGQSGLGKTLLIHDILKNLKNIIQNYEKKLLEKNQIKEEKNLKNNSVERKRNKSKRRRKYKKSKSTIINKNSSSSNKKKIKNICSIFLNANNFKNCDLFLTELIFKVFLEIKNKKKNRKSFNPIFKIQDFKNKIKKMLENNYIIIIIDELESLFLKDQKNFELVIDFLNINQKGFLKIGISNSLNLIKSEKNNDIFVLYQFLIFKPYNVNDLSNILEKKFEEIIKKINIKTDKNTFIEKNVFKFLSKKVISNKSSDVRTVLNFIYLIFKEKLDYLRILKKLKKNHFNKYDLKIGIKEVNKILKEKFKDEKEEIFEKLNLSAHIYLLTLYQNMQKDGQYIPEKKIKADYKEISKIFSINKNIDLSIIKDTLINYSFIKTKKKQKKQNFITTSLSKKRLKNILKTNSLFVPYFKKNKKI